MMKRPIKWTEGMAAAFVTWRRNNQRAWSMPMALALYDDICCTEFEQWYATQRLLGEPLPKVKE